MKASTKSILANQLTPIALVNSMMPTMLWSPSCVLASALSIAGR